MRSQLGAIGSFADLEASAPSAAVSPSAPVSAKGQRLVLIDGARGYLLSMMFLAHSAFVLSWFHVGGILRNLHHHTFLAVWDAEFFVPLSGFVCALAYLGVFVREGWGATWRSILMRLRWVYLYHVVVATLIVLAKTLQGPLTSDGGSMLYQFASILTFVNQPRYLDILMLYIALMLFMPFAFALLRTGRTFVFFAILIALWGVAELSLDQMVSEFVTKELFVWYHYFRLSGNFNPLSWALLFYAGFFIGYQMKTRGREFTHTYFKPDTRIFAISVLTIAMVVTIKLAVGIGTRLLPPEGARHTISTQAFAVIAAVTYCFYYLLNRRTLPTGLAFLSKLLRSVLSFPPLVLLGQNSLFVYSFHVIVVSFINVVANVGHQGSNTVLMVSLLIGCYLSIFAATLLKRRYLRTLP